MEKIRTMPSGATRNSNIGKLEYQNYSHPLCEYSFANYMKGKQIIGGEYRKGNNRQKGLGRESLFESLVRHIEIIKLLYKGYRVFETKTGDVTDLVVLQKGQILDEESFDFCEEKIMINELNALRFNSEGLKLDYLSDNYMINEQI